MKWYLIPIIQVIALISAICWFVKYVFFEKNNTIRSDGFYWVKTDRWRVAFYYSDLGKWLLFTGKPYTVKTSELKKIGNKIKEPKGYTK